MGHLERKKTILYIVTKAHWGGAQKYVYDLAVKASRRGYVPIVACGNEGTLTERLREHGIPTERIHSLERDVHIFKDIRSFFEITRIIRATNPVVIHVNSSKAGGIGALAARLSSTACVVFTVHGLPQNEVRSWLSKKIIAFLTWLTALLAHRVIAVARGDVELLRKQPFLSKKIQHIQNGIDHEGRDRMDARQIMLSHIPDTKARDTLAQALWIGTVAELTPNKGHRYALEALIQLCCRYPDVAYILVGDGELAEEYQIFVREHGLQNHVFFTGFVPHAEELYSAFDIYLAPSIKEGLPYTIIEAMCSGIPIVASAVGGIPDIITDGVSGTLIVPHSSLAIINALARHLGESAYRTALGEHARTQALKTYTAEAMAGTTFMLYDHCVHPRDTTSV